ncbi:MAG: hypothetical protein K0U57_00740 [Alphaproteobacteria bacterium]|nr:hypothetical protein [Alphaproteobacteria bacterium]
MNDKKTYVSKLSKEKEVRLKAALKSNLARRKAQAKARDRINKTEEKDDG